MRADRRVVVSIALAAALWGAAAPAQGAETVTSARMEQTRVVLRVDLEEPLAVRTRFEQQPPAIIVAFPGQRVLSALPERTQVGQGIVRAITNMATAAARVHARQT